MSTNAGQITSADASLKLGKPKSLWREGFDRLCRDKLAVTALSIVGTYLVIALLSALGIIAGNWGAEIGPSYSAPSGSFSSAPTFLADPSFKK